MNPKAEKLKKDLLNPFKFWLFTFFKVPMARMAGLKMEELTTSKCITSVPFKRLNKNPFKSIYFAVLSMSAEFSTAALALLKMEEVEDSIAFIVIDLEAKFHKKATERIYFSCENAEEFQDAIHYVVKNPDASKVVKAHSVGRNSSGLLVAEFWITWSFKKRVKR